MTVRINLSGIKINLTGLSETVNKTLIKLSDEGLGTTLLPYLHTLDLNEKNKAKLKQFVNPKPSREVSLIFSKNELKIHIIEALRTTISGVLRGAIAFQNVEIISPLQKK